MFLALDLLFESAAVLEQVLRGFLIVLEVGRGRLGLDVLQLFAARRDIKETSRAVQLAHEGRQMKLATPELTTYRSS